MEADASGVSEVDVGKCLANKNVLRYVQKAMVFLWCMLLGWSVGLFYITGKFPG